MKYTAGRWLLGLLVGTAASGSIAAVDVRFVDPKRFIDATVEGYGDEPESNRVLVELRGHLLALGARCIPDDQSLQIVVREVDLAGDYDWRHRQMAGNFRLLPNVAWSRMTIEYVWRAAKEGLIAQSIDRLEEANYLSSTTRPRNWDVALPDEKAMLTRWFEARFCRQGNPAEPRRSQP